MKNLKGLKKGEKKLNFQNVGGFKKILTNVYFFKNIYKNFLLQAKR